MLIEVEQLTHVAAQGTAHEKRILEAVDLRIQPGEFVAIMGANGSGKSTLVKHFNGLLLPSSGRVRIDGLDPSDPRQLWAIREHVGMVFQNPDHQMVSPVVEEEVAFGLENLRLPPNEIRSRVEAALEAVHLAPHRLSNPGHLSGGQKQRIAIASILAMRPRVLVLDEPTAMLDVCARREVMAAVRDTFEREGITVVLVTHSVQEAEAAQRVLVLRAGRLVADGPGAEVLGDVERMDDLSLEIPPAMLLSRLLRQGGLPLDDPSPRDARAAADAILRALRGRGGERA